MKAEGRFVWDARRPGCRKWPIAAKGRPQSDGISWGSHGVISHFETNRCVHFVGRVRYCPVARNTTREFGDLDG